VHREKGTLLAYLPPALWPITRDGRHGHTAAAEVPPRREVYVRPRDGFAVGAEPTSKLDRHVDAVAQGPQWTRWPHRVWAVAWIRPLQRSARRQRTELTRQGHPAPVPVPIMQGRSRRLAVVLGLSAVGPAAFHGVLVGCGGAAAAGVCRRRARGGGGFLIKA
jgi:hypothetical protein